MDFNLGYILRVNYTSCRRQVSEGNASLSAAASLYTRATTSHSVSSFSFSTQKTQDSTHPEVFAMQSKNSVLWNCCCCLLELAKQKIHVLELPSAEVETFLLDPMQNCLG